MNMYNPYEWAGRYSIGLTDHHHAELFNLAGSIWFVFTAMQWQGVQLLFTHDNILLASTIMFARVEK